jgi:hypothetical protein
VASEPDRLVDAIRQKRAGLTAGLSPFAAVRSGFRSSPGGWLALAALVAAGFTAAHYLGPRLATAGKKTARGWLRKRVGQQVAATVLTVVTHALAPKAGNPDGTAARANGAASASGPRKRSRPRARRPAAEPPPQP